MDECLQKKALITGITCQDGSYLPEPLLNKGYEVHGINRRSSNLNTERLRHIYVGPETSDSRIKLQYGDRPDASSLRNWIDKICLDEVYHLDAQSHVVVSFKNLEYTADVVATGALRLLQAVQSHIEAINRKQIFINLYNRQNVRLIVCTQKTSACLRPRTSACLRPTQNVGERERERDREQNAGLHINYNENKRLALMSCWSSHIYESSSRKQGFSSFPRDERRVLILEMNGILLKTIDKERGDLLLESLQQHMNFIEENTRIAHYVRKDALYFLDFCMDLFEVWIWTTERLSIAQKTLAVCFPKHHQRFHIMEGQGACQKTDIRIGYKFVHHKNLDTIWKIFPHLDGNNTIIFDDTLYHVIWNMKGTYVILPKLWRQSSEELENFLSKTMIPWLYGWICSKNRRSYTCNTIVNQRPCDRETYYVLEQYIKKRYK